MMTDILPAFQKLEDLLQEVAISDFKVKEEKNIFLATKTIRNMVDAVMDNLSSSKPTLKEQEKAKGILVRSVKATSSTLARINNLAELSDAMKLVKSALSFALKKQSALLESFK